MTTQDVGDTRLMALADILDKTNNYNQRDGNYCAYGHYRKCVQDFTSVQDEFHLTTHEAIDIFGSYGCDDAGRDGKKAAAYIRDFVNKRNPKVEQEVEELMDG